MKVKICGITRVEDALHAVKLGADAIGFILYQGSKRYINPYNIKNIINQLPPFVFKVGVFVNESVEFINRTVNETGINLVQLHGDETPEFSREINAPVIKAFRINDKFNFDILLKYADCYFLLDTYDVDNFGGTGKKFDWLKIPDSIRNKIILAGGITVNDLEIIKNEISPYAIDISSSIEMEPGKKDKHKMIAFFEKLNNMRK